MNLITSSTAKRLLIPVGLGLALVGGSVATEALRFAPGPELGEEVTMFVVEPNDPFSESSTTGAENGSDANDLVVVVSSDDAPITLERVLLLDLGRGAVVIKHRVSFARG